MDNNERSPGGGESNDTPIITENDFGMKWHKYLIYFSLWIAALRLVSVEPERKKIELPATVVLALVVQEEAKPPPVAMQGEDRPEDVVDIALMRVERTNGKVVVCGALFVERPDLESCGKEKFSEHSC